MTNTFRQSFTAEKIKFTDKLDLVDRCVFFLVAGAIAIVGVNRPSFAGLPPSVFMISGAFFLTIIFAPSSEVNQRRLTSLDVLLGVWFTTKLVIEYINTAPDSVKFALGPVLDCVLVMMVVIIVKRRVGTTHRAIAAARVLLTTSVAVSVIALLQVAGINAVNSALVAVMRGSALEARTQHGWDIRATSTIGHWTALGGYLCVCIAVCCVLIIQTQRSKGSLRGLAIVLSIQIAGQVSTFTFATIAVSAAILLSTLYIVRPRPAIVFGAVTLLGSLLLIFWDAIDARIIKQAEPEAFSTSSFFPESVNFRINIWTHETLPAIASHPFTGWGMSVYNYIGTGRVSRLLQWESPESEWMRTAISSGLIVLALEVGTLSLVLAFMWRITRGNARSPFYPLFVMTVAMIIAMSIHSHLADRAFLLSFWIVVTSIQMLTNSFPARRKLWIL